MHSCRQVWTERILEYWGSDPVEKLTYKSISQLSLEEKDYLNWVQNATINRELDHTKASYHLMDSHSFDPVINRHLIFSYLIECLGAKSDDFELFFEALPYALKHPDEYQSTFFAVDYPYLSGAIKCLSETADFPKGKQRLAAILRLWRIQGFEQLS